MEGRRAGQALPDEAMDLRVTEQRQRRRLQGQSIAGECEEPLLLRPDQVRKPAQLDAVDDEALLLSTS